MDDVWEDGLELLSDDSVVDMVVEFWSVPFKGYPSELFNEFEPVIEGGDVVFAVAERMSR